ncbi:MAG: MauE/DoxX family redox-associated membrane protein [Candidatus Rhabdochlamydia sp.]
MNMSHKKNREDKNFSISVAIRKLLEYKPLLIIVIFALILSYIYAYNSSSFMYGLMGYFFLFLAMFKFFNLKEFVRGFETYDIISKRFKLYGFLYPFIEFSLGIAYLTEYHLMIVNIVTLIVMIVSGFGVVKSVLSGQKIKCACLGSTLNVPLGIVSIVENFSMAAMAAYMLYRY